MLILREEQLQLNEAKNEILKLKASLSSAKQNADRIKELEAIIIKLTSELEVEKQEKDALVVEKQTMQKEREEVWMQFDWLLLLVTATL